MKKTLRIFSLMMVLVLALSVMTSCEIPQELLDAIPDEIIVMIPGLTPQPPADHEHSFADGKCECGAEDPNYVPPVGGDAKVTVYWCQGQKVLREDKVDKGTVLTSWEPKVSGKQFLGWFSNPGCTTEFDFTKPINADTDIYASFKTVGSVDEPVEPEYADYYLIGTGLGSLRVSGWNHEASATKLGMKDAGNGKYELTIDMYAGDMFQICHGLAWDGQMGLGCIPGAALVEGSETSGEVKDADGNVVFTGVQEYSNPMTAWNITLAAGQDGKYTFTLDPVNGEITWKLVERLDPDSYGDITIDHTYTVAGSSGLCGSEWDPSYANNDLVLNEETGLLTITFTGIAAGTYEFKICEDYGWSVSYGDSASGSPDGNAIISVPADDTTVIISFHPVTHAITVTDAEGNTLSSTGGTPSIPDGTEVEIIFVGSMTGSNWDTTNSSGEWALTLGEDGKTWTGTLVVTTETQVKLYDKGGICGHDGGWIDPAAGTGENGNAVLAAGTYHFQYVVGDTNFTYWADGEDAPVTPDPEPTPDPEVPTEGTVVYFQPTTGAEGCWDAYCEGYAVYCWNDAGNIWVMMEEVDTDLSLYSATIPAGYPNVIFVSLKSLAAGANWGNKDSQTVDLVLPTDGSNLFTLVNSWDESKEWKGTGTWSTK